MAASHLIKDPASYRDPAGFVFTYQGSVYRQVNACFKEDFDHFISSGLYEKLVGENLLISHQVVHDFISDDPQAYLVLKPEQLPFISYPYEWSFDMLKDAALLTLRVAKEAMQHGMMLKDATPFNVQFFGGRMIFIDTLSFERHDAAKPWIAYRQFCENLLAPLALMHYNQLPLQPLQLAYPEGIPLKVASKLLPWKTRLNLHLYLHIHLGAGMHSKKIQATKTTQFSQQKLSNIFQSLQTAVSSLRLNYKSTWSDYYTEVAQRDQYLTNKKQVVAEWLNKGDYKTALDAGANDGSFSELVSVKGISAISADGDHYAVNKLYQKVKVDGSDIHPLLIDLSNPSPPIGMNNSERSALLKRINTDVVLALAVIHHLAIGKNIPFDAIAQLFRNLGKALIIEFVPKEDEKINEMLAGKKDIYDWYSEKAFITSFAKYYFIKERQTILPSNRTLFLMEPNEL